MAQYFSIHPINPQRRLIHQAAEIIGHGGVVAYPTDSSYALGCSIGNKEAMNRIRIIRKIGEDHNFTLVCKDLSELSIYAKVDNDIYRLLKRFTPGPYTFILAATGEVPRRLQNPKRRSIGLRVPDFRIVELLLGELNEPLMSSTLIMPGETLPLNDAEQIRRALEHEIDLVIDGGPCDFQPTSVVDLISGIPNVRRVGKGDVSTFISSAHK
ncbi:L-threonylcarbamoyladenylate synthase [Candidatus Spongiihabitans sp.]|uniref:L-threonylcarbamoyladenylate synthase n=1 Tax=Candidatus Spongiihabitans sp. TaxID=3101308 RepID=UPI003C6F82F1